MLYQEGLYGEIRFGSNDDNIIVGFGPTDLNAYQNTPENIIFYWTMDPYGPEMDDLGWVWELETSLNSDFSLSNQFSSASTEPQNIVDGVIYKGLVIPSYARLQGENRNIYWRVRVRIGENQISQWSSSQYILPEAVDVVATDAQQAFLPDVLYKKSPDANIYKIQNAYAKEIDLINKQAQLVRSDFLIYRARDSALSANFGALLGIMRPQAYDTVPALPSVDYRGILRAFMANIRSAPSMEAISKMVYAMYRTWPTFYPAAGEQEDAYSVPLADVGSTPYYSYGFIDPPEDDNLILYSLDRQNIDFGVIVEIENRMTPDNKLVLTELWAQGIIKKMIQAHVPVYFRYI